MEAAFCFEYYPSFVSNVSIGLLDKNDNKSSFR